MSATEAIFTASAQEGRGSEVKCCHPACPAVKEGRRHQCRRRQMKWSGVPACRNPVVYTLYIYLGLQCRKQMHPCKHTHTCTCVILFSLLLLTRLVCICPWTAFFTPRRNPQHNTHTHTHTHTHTYIQKYMNTWFTYVQKLLFQNFGGMFSTNWPK